MKKRILVLVVAFCMLCGISVTAVGMQTRVKPAAEKAITMDVQHFDMIEEAEAPVITGKVAAGFIGSGSGESASSRFWNMLLIGGVLVLVAGGFGMKFY